MPNIRLALWAAQCNLSKEAASSIDKAHHKQCFAK